MSSKLNLNIIIIGGGLVGCACGHFLAQKGVNVTILEQNCLASGASGANSGLLSIGPVDSTKLVTLFKEGRRIVQEEINEQISSFEYIHSGFLYIGLNDQDESELKNRAEALSIHGIDSQFLYDRELFKVEPVLRREIPCGLFIPSTGHFNPFLLNYAFAKSVIQNGGVIHQGVRVSSVKPEGNSFLVQSEKETFTSDAVVLATGWQAYEIAKPLGLTIPVVPARGQIIISEPLGSITQKVIMTLDDYYFRQTVSGTCQIGSQLELVGPDKTLTLPVLREIAKRVTDLIPFLKKIRMLRAYAGLRPLSPDSMAIVGNAPGIEGLYLACGHSRTGATMSTLTGKVISELIIDGRTKIDISVWNPKRFDGKTFEESYNG